MKSNIIKEKSFAFSKEIVFLYQYLTRQKKEYVLSRQLLRSGTSVGANTAEGVSGRSRNDFYNCLHIAYKEAHESYFWLMLLKETGYFENGIADKAIEGCTEIIRMLCSILKTTSENKGYG